MDYNNLSIQTSGIINPVSPVDTKSVSTAQSGENIDLVLVDRKKQELYEKLGITPDEYDQIVSANPNFPNLDFDEKQKIVKEFRASLKSSIPAQTETVEQDNTDSVLDFTYEKYQEAGYEKKNIYCQAELARNFFIYGLKDKDGKVIIQPHSEQAWNSMSEDEKQTFVAEFVKEVKSDKKLAEIQTSIASKTNSEQREALTDTTVRTIQVANSLGMSFADFLKLPEAQKIDATEKYLNGLKNESVDLNETDRKYLERQTAFRTITSSILKEKFDVEVPADISASELARYFNDFNLNGTEEMYNYFSEIVNNPDATDAEKAKAQKFLDDNKLLVTSPAGNDIVNKTKAANYVELKADFDAFQKKIDAGETLTPEEQSRYECLGKYLSSDEAKSLQEIAQHLPKPDGDYEKSVVQEIEAVKSNSKGLINDERLQGAAIIKFIENKTQGMSAEEKEKYIATFLKFNNDTTSVMVLKHFGKEIESLYGNKYLLSEGSVNIADGNLNQAQVDEHLKARNQVAKNGDGYEKQIAYNATMTVTTGFNGVGDEANGIREILSKGNVDSTQYYSAEQSYRIMCATAGSDAKITNSAIQARVVAYRQQSPAYSDDCAKYDIDILGNYHEANRYNILDTATNGRANVTGYAAEHGAVEKLGKDDQVKGHSLLFDRVNEYFEGEDAIRYQNALGDQIQNCDKDNQLAMHEKMMTSQYSEVQEHVAGNIKNYDPSVQPDAMSSVFRSGNQEAIEAAVSSISEFKSPDAQQIAMKQVTMMFANGTLSDAEIANLSPAQRREYFVGLFDKASPADKIKFLKEIPAGRNKKTVYNLIGTYYKRLFVKMVQDDVQTAETMFNMGLKSQLHNIIEKCIVGKAETDPSFKILRDRLNLTSEEEYHQTAKPVSYSSVPNDLNSLFKEQGNLSYKA